MVSIRLITAGDAPAILTAVDRSRPELARWMSWFHPGYSVADAQEWVARVCESHAAREALNWAMLSETGAIVGVVGIEGLQNEDGPSIGFWVATPYTGRGLASAAVSQACEWLRQRTHATRVVASVHRDNHASRRVIERNDFVLTAERLGSDSRILEYHLTWQRDPAP